MPSKWLARIRDSMARLTPEFSAGRTIQQYTEDHYLPAASAYGQRAAKDSALGVELLEWQHNIAQEWNTVRFGAMQVETRDGLHFFRVQVLPGNLPVDDLKVELYASPLEKGDAVIETMTACECKDAERSHNLLDSGNCGTCPKRLHSAHRPYHPNASVPLEAGQILWQR